MEQQEGRVVFLAGQRLDLCPLSKGDARKCLVWMNDQEVTQFISKYLPVHENEQEEWLANLGKQKEHDIVLAIVTKEGGAHIGNIGLHGIKPKDRVATIGIAIGDKTCWSKGYGTEAITVLLGYAFNQLNLRKVCLSVFDFNARAAACYKKCGFKEEGRKVEQYYRNGKYRDETLMAVFKRDWLVSGKKE